MTQSHLLEALQQTSQRLAADLVDKTNQARIARSIMERASCARLMRTMRRRCRQAGLSKWNGQVRIPGLKTEGANMDKRKYRIPTGTCFLSQILRQIKLDGARFCGGAALPAAGLTLISRLKGLFCGTVLEHLLTWTPSAAHFHSIICSWEGPLQ
eukprot:1161470-Pelagomonas_calceolata.AAC.6